MLSLEIRGSCSSYGPRSIEQVEELRRRKLAKETAETSKQTTSFLLALKSPVSTLVKKLKKSRNRCDEGDLQFCIVPYYALGLSDHE